MKGERETMATKKEEAMEALISDSMTIVSEPKKAQYEGEMVTVFLPAIEDNGPGGMKVDQYEHVTIANEKGEMCWKVLRGEPVEVPVPVFVILKGKYPKI